MSLIIWKDSYELGIPEIDQQHKSAIGFINRLYDSLQNDTPPAELRAQVEEMLANMENHFSSEESLMQDIEYPKLAEHAAMHRDLFLKFFSLKEKLGTEKQVAPSVFAIEAKRWLTLYVLTEDVDWVEYYLNKQKKS